MIMAEKKKSINQRNPVGVDSIPEPSHFTSIILQADPKSSVSHLDNDSQALLISFTFNSSLLSL